MAKIKSHTLRIYNSSNQMIPLQVRAPGSDFYTNEQQVRLNPGKSVILMKSHVRMDQIENLQKRGILRVVFDSEVAQDQGIHTS